MKGRRLLEDSSAWPIVSPVIESFTRESLLFRGSIPYHTPRRCIFSKDIVLACRHLS